MTARGLQKRSSDLAVVARNLDFKIPEEVLGSRRRIAIFTTDATASSDHAEALTTPGLIVIGNGEAGVDRIRMIDYLSDQMGYHVIMMASGPSVLQFLLEAKRLDLLYVTEAQREIPFDDPSTVKMLLPGGKKVNDLRESSITHQYLQENVVTEDGSLISQLFLRYDRKSILVDRRLNAS